MAKKERGNGKMDLGRQAERMLRQSQASGVVQPRVLERNAIGKFLVASLAAELNPDLGIAVPEFPVSFYKILMNLGGQADVPDPVWKKRTLAYQIPSPRIVFFSVVEAKNVAHAETISIVVKSGWANGAGNEFAVARAKVRAGQILVDFLHFLEGKNKAEFWLNPAYVAQDIVVDRCFTTAEESGVALKFLKVRQSAQFGHEELMENLGGAIAIRAFEGALEYTYHLPHPKVVVTAVRGLVMAVVGRSTDERAVEYFAPMPDDERRLLLHVACDVLDDLAGMEIPEAAAAAKMSGNGHEAGVVEVTEDEVVSEVAATA